MAGSLPHFPIMVVAVTEEDAHRMADALVEIARCLKMPGAKHSTGGMRTNRTIVNGQIEFVLQADIVFTFPEALH